MAMEKLYVLHESQRYDLLVVDTPPTRSALDFLDAPDNLNELLDARAFRLLIAPAQRIGRGYLRGLNMATTAMTRMVRRVTGSELLAEVGEFFAAFEGMYDGLEALAAAERRRIRALLATVPNLGVVRVPLLADDVHDLPGLRRLGGYLFAGAGAA